MTRPGTAALLSAALGLVLFVRPAEGTQNTPLAPRVKGVVISRSEHVLVIDPVLRDPGQPRPARVVMTSRTRVGGRRATAAVIRVHDLVRADGVESADGSLEALYVEVVLTAEEVAVARPERGAVPGWFWQWILNGLLTIPLP